MPERDRDEAIRLLAQAKVARGQGDFERAIGYLNEVVAFGTGDKALAGEYPRREAYVQLYKAHRALNHHKEALDCYIEAMLHGATVEQLTEPD